MFALIKRDGKDTTGRKQESYNRNPKNRLDYRQRGRGEGTFGSLTNAYGDRLKTFDVQTTKTRSAARVFFYQVRLLIRIIQELLGIIRHTLKLATFLYVSTFLIS